MTDPNRVDSGLSFRFDSDPELVPGPNLMVNFAGLPEPEPFFGLAPVLAPIPTPTLL